MTINKLASQHGAVAGDCDWGLVSLEDESATHHWMDSQ